MSHDDRDQRGGHPVRHSGLLPCGCCPAMSWRDRLGPRRTERQRAVADQLIDADDDADGQHMYTGEDSGDPIFYTSATGEPPKSSHDLTG